MIHTLQFCGRTFWRISAKECFDANNTGILAMLHSKSARINTVGR